MCNLDPGDELETTCGAVCVYIWTYMHICMGVYFHSLIYKWHVPLTHDHE